jgi:dihydrofolate reductase
MPRDTLPAAARFFSLGGRVHTCMTAVFSRRLRQSALVSINGVASRPLDWAGPYFGAGSANHSLRALRDSGEYAAALNAIPKYVFSSTLGVADWNNTTVVRGDVAAAVTAMKAEPGADLLFYGHGRFGQTLVDAGLVDELTLTVVPVFAGGEPFHQPFTGTQTWELVSAGPGNDPGLASLTYRPQR